MSSYTRSAKSPKVKRSRIEADVEKCRCEGNWSRAVELVTLHQHEKTSLMGYLVDLVMGESKLEMCDKDSPLPGDLDEAEQFLRDGLRSADEPYKLEATILWNKLLYLRGKYKEVVDNLESVNLKIVRIDNPNSRLTKLIAEGFAMIGLSMEQLKKNPTKKGDNDDRILEYFELAGDLCIYHLQELERTGTSIMGCDTSSGSGVPKSIETAIQRSPIMYIQQGELNRAVGRFRQLLRCVETAATKPLRQTLARQLAEVLLRGVCSGTYQRYVVDAERQHSGGPAGGMQPGTAAMWKQPHRYPHDRFVPEDHVQEAVLMLLISEYIANQEAILNRSSELSEARIRTLHNTTAVYDLLAIALVRKRCYSYLSKTLEHSLKFSYKEFHVWYQFALSLISAQKYYRAYLVLLECERIEPERPAVPLLAANVCLEYLHLIEEGIAAAKRAVELSQPPLKARAHLVVGWGLSLRARECRVADKKKQLQQQALQQYNSAVEIDRDDYLSWYHLGLEQACLRHLDAALFGCHRALTLHPGFSPALHLLALLHTASGQPLKAAQVIQAAIHDHPNNVSLLLTKAKLDAVVHGPETALQSYRTLIEIWKDNYSPDYDASGFLEKLKSQYAQFQFYELSERDNGSQRADSAAASRMENTLSEIASSVGSGPPRVNLSQASHLQLQILLSLAELYLEMSKLRECQECVDEAAGVSKLSHQVLYMRGRIFEAKKRFQEARNMFESAIAINPSHVKTLQRLGRLLHMFGEHQLSEKVLRDALSNDQFSSVTWQLLGEVLGSLGQEEEASQCLMVSADLEQTEPLEPFYFLPRGINFS